MLKRMGFFPRYSVEDTNFTPQFAIVSISDHLRPAEISGTDTILRLEFLDIEDFKESEIGQEEIDAGLVFNKQMAEDIISFIDSIANNSEINTLVVHCNAGVSRSAAVALCINEYLTQNKLVDLNFSFINQYQACYANRWVTKVFEELLNMKVQIPTVAEAKRATESLLVSVPRMFKPM